MDILITGTAGFIGAALAGRLLQMGHTVSGADNLNDYYDVNLKLARLARLESQPRFRFDKLDISDRGATAQLFARKRFDAVVHLAAQVGVRHALVDPNSYVDANLTGFGNILEGCRSQKTGHLIFASSSSVYGAGTRLPYVEEHNVDHPLSLYAATKKANELMAHSYAHLYRLPCTGLRFFTVYGPWGRPDMATFKFTRSILAGQPIQVYNHGKMTRDFTYVDDIVESMVRLLDHPATPDPQWNGSSGKLAASSAPYRIYNIGNSASVPLMRYIGILEQCLGKKAVIDLQPIQPGEVTDTLADTGELEALVNFRPNTPIEDGLARFVHWYKSFYQVD